MRTFYSIKYLLVFHLIHLTFGDESPAKKPNIIVIVSDDMGINDISYHGSDQIPTPNIDSLALFGIALNRYYVAPMCTPSRSSLMTGKYPSTVGMQHFVIPSWEPWGLGLDQKIMPEYMRDAGYDTHIIGKWHLGFYRQAYTPTERGFNSHFGYLGPYIDYYNYTLSAPEKNLNTGYDMRKNLSINYDPIGTYATDLFSDAAIQTIHNHDKSKPLFMYLAHLAPHTANENDPLQVLPDEYEKFAHIENDDRRRYAAMVSRLDRSVGAVIAALQETDMLSNTVILFFCDNGAPTIGQHANAGSNFPFRGQKDTPWEGAVRSGAAIWSLALAQRQQPSNQLIHISDWLPTFAHLAGIELDGPVDGHNIWDALSTGSDSPRTEVLCNLDDVVPYISLISGDWKLIKGTTNAGKYDGWLGDLNKTESSPLLHDYGKMILQSDAGQILSKYAYNSNNEVEQSVSSDEINILRKLGRLTCNNVQQPTELPFQCHPLIGPCLFNLRDDPCEKINLATIYPNILSDLLHRANGYRQNSQPPRNRPIDKRCNPANFNDTWTWWYDKLNLTESSVSASRQQSTNFGLVFGFSIFIVGFYGFGRFV